MKSILELNDLKEILLPCVVLSLLVIIFYIFFLIPLKKKIDLVQDKKEFLKQKLYIHNNLLPIYYQIRNKLKQVDYNLDIKDKKLDLNKITDILSECSSYNIKIIDIKPELKGKIKKNGIIAMWIDLRGDFISFINWSIYLLKCGYVKAIDSIKIKSDINKLNINIKLKINI